MTKTLTRRPDPMTVLFEAASALWRRAGAATASPRTRDTAHSLYERAAGYERTQPGFAADLRAAAEAMDRAAARSRRA